MNYLLTYSYCLNNDHNNCLNDHNNCLNNDHNKCVQLKMTFWGGNKIFSKCFSFISCFFNVSFLFLTLNASILNESFIFIIVLV